MSATSFIILVNIIYIDFIFFTFIDILYAVGFCSKLNIFSISKLKKLRLLQAPRVQIATALANNRPMRPKKCICT